MSKKSLLISVDAQDEANTSQDVEISYVDDDFFRPIDDIEIFNVDPSIIHKFKNTKNGDEASEDHVKFNVIINKDDTFPSALPRRYRNPRLHKYLSQQDFPDSDFLNSEESRSRRLERAKRFNLDVEMEAARPILPKPTEDDMRNLYAYFQLDIDDSKVKSKIRLNTLHIRGVNEFSTQDVFDYFDKYDPEYIEWVDDASCNVVWDKENDAACAMLDSSFPATIISKNDTHLDQDDVNEEYISPLKRNTEDEDGIGKLEPDESTKSGYKQNADGSITVDRLLYSIPPNFRWRIARKSENPRSKILLLRFAHVDDVKAKRSESKSEFYRKNGNPNFGNAVGIISKSKRERTRRRDLDESFPGHIDYNRGSEDLRSKLRNVARWNEIKSCNRRNSDDEDYSPYSDDDGADKDSRRSKKRKALRMKMRADDVESKLQVRRKQTDALFGRRKNLLTAERSYNARYEHDDRNENVSDEDDRSDNGDIQRNSIKARLGKRGSNSDESPIRRSRSRSPLDVNSRLEQYRMKITVENDASEGEILSDNEK